MEIWAIKNQKENPMEMLQIGEFDSRIDKELLANRIAQVCGAMTPVHNTTNSYVHFHTLFFKMWGTQISRLLDTIEYKYEPLDNYRRTENIKHIENEEANITDNSVITATDTDKGNMSSTNEHQTSAYNESLYQPENKDIYAENHDVTKGTNSTNNRTGNRTKENNSTDDKKISGLNGLFTTQQLIEQEREISQFNIYEWIVDKYMNELFLCVF